MWYINLSNDNKINSEYELLGHQFIDIYIYNIYNSFEVNYNEDYKTLNKYLEEQIVKYINNISSSKIETLVYNYGIDNAILLLNNYIVNSKKILIQLQKVYYFLYLLADLN